jgi:hypothetical protein
MQIAVAANSAIAATHDSFATPFAPTKRRDAAITGPAITAVTTYDAATIKTKRMTLHGARIAPSDATRSDRAFKRLVERLWGW